MGRRLFVGNLGFSVGDSDLKQMFEPYGTVQLANVVVERDGGRSRGFGFVEMASDEEATAAMAALNGTKLGGVSLIVNEATPMRQGPGARRESD